MCSILKLWHPKQLCHSHSLGQSTFRRWMFAKARTPTGSPNSLTAPPHRKDFKNLKEIRGIPITLCEPTASSRMSFSSTSRRFSQQQAQCTIPHGALDHQPFLSLPPELRLLIYEDLFKVPAELPLTTLQHGADSIANSAILLVCRKTRQEANGMYRSVCARSLKETTFALDHAQKNDIPALEEAALAHVAHLALLNPGARRIFDHVVLVQTPKAGVRETSAQWWAVSKPAGSSPLTSELLSRYERDVRKDLWELGEMAEERERADGSWVREARKYQLMLYITHLP